MSVSVVVLRRVLCRNGIQNGGHHCSVPCNRGGGDISHRKLKLETVTVVQPVTPTLRRERPEDQEFETSLGYMGLYLKRSKGEKGREEGPEGGREGRRGLSKFIPKALF